MATMREEIIATMMPGYPAALVDRMPHTDDPRELLAAARRLQREYESHLKNVREMDRIGASPHFKPPRWER